MLYPTWASEVQVPEAAQHPVVVWTAVIAASVWVVATGLAKIIGPIGEAFESNAERRRQYKQRDEDARIVDLSSQVDHLAGRVWTLEQYAERQNTYLHAHAVWDHQIVTAAVAAGLDVPPPPPLRPPMDAP